uniref:macrophage mannose receptor 1-like n=1 Tax=Semicossyphus pulcher TaxID=241346 RepID=UPI0037E7B2D0
MDYCREKHTDLATIGSMEDVNTLNHMVDDSRLIYVTDSSFRVWIGLYDDLNSWKWSLSDPSFYSAGQTEFTQWLTGNPVNLNSGRHCATITNLGTWNDQPCTSTFKSVCCDVTESDVEFVLISTDMTWTDAQSYCREHHTDLVSVRDLAENIQVAVLVPLLQEVWIGLSRESWKWLDGSDSSFRYWKALEPQNLFTGEECVAADFSDGGKWEDWSCAWKRAFICYGTVKSKQVIKVSLLKKSPSLDLSDSAVMEDILRQLEVNLKDEGVNATLSWRKQPDGNVFHKLETEKEEKEEKEELGC